jgi:hypothetical protein
MRRRESETLSFARQLSLAEYSSLRGEITQSLEYAQSIVRFSIAGYAAVLAAGLIAAYNADGDPPYTFLSTVVLVLFGFALPIGMTAASWSWLGELLRMRRVGSYLRGLEQYLVGAQIELPGRPALGWEMNVNQWASKIGNVWPYLGTSAIYFGSSCLSLFIFVVWWGQVFDWDLGGTLWLWLVAAGLINAACISVSFVLARRIQRLTHR